jgi:hypothetical protein
LGILVLGFPKPKAPNPETPFRISKSKSIKLKIKSKIGNIYHFHEKKITKQMAKLFILKN